MLLAHFFRIHFNLLKINFFRYENVFQGAKKALETKSLITLIIGGLLIGVGMQISGSCPGMVLVQLGAGVPWSYLTFIGALSGALAHGLVEKWLNSGKSETLFTSKALFELIRLPAIVVRLIFIILIAIVLFLMEFFIPWTNEYANPIPAEPANIFIYKAWPPSGKFLFFNHLFRFLQKYQLG